MERAGDGTSIAEGLFKRDDLFKQRCACCRTQAALSFQTEWNGQTRHAMRASVRKVSIGRFGHLRALLQRHGKNKTQGNTKAEVQNERASGRSRKEQHAHEGNLAFRRQTQGCIARHCAALSYARNTVVDAPGLLSSLKPNRSVTFARKRRVAVMRNRLASQAADCARPLRGIQKRLRSSVTVLSVSEIPMCCWVPSYRFIAAASKPYVHVERLRARCSSGAKTTMLAPA